MTQFSRSVVRSLPGAAIGILLACVALLAAYIGGGGTGLLACACGLITTASLAALVWRLDPP
jgi:hypothetical protein